MKKIKLLTAFVFIVILSGCYSTSVIEANIEVKERKFLYDTAQDTLSTDYVMRSFSNAIAQATGIKRETYTKTSTTKRYTRGQEARHSCDNGSCEVSLIFHNGEITESMGKLTTRQVVTIPISVKKYPHSVLVEVQFPQKADQRIQRTPLGFTFDPLLSEGQVKEVLQKIQTFTPPVFNYNKRIAGSFDVFNSVDVVLANFVRFANVKNPQVSRPFRLRMYDPAKPDGGHQVHITIHPSSTGTAIEYYFDSVYEVKAGDSPRAVDPNAEQEIPRNLEGIARR